MARRPDPDRKPQLLGEIIEYLLDKPLASITFRTLAEHLGVSAFTLVYHFGSRSHLVRDVVDEICAHQRTAFGRAEISTESIDDYFATFRRYWHWTLEPRNRQLQRLEFEAAMAESLEGRPDAVTRKTLSGWHDIAFHGMRALGVPEEVVLAESRAMVDIMYGLQYDLVVRGDAESVDAAFERVLESYRLRVHDLVAGER